MLTATVTQPNGRSVTVRFSAPGSTDTTVPVEEDVMAISETTDSTVPESLLRSTETTDSTVPGEEAHVTYAAGGAEAETTAEVKTAPNPIAPESKELAWSAGSFVVLFVLLRFFFVPRLKKGMAARYEGIRGDIEGADRARADARGAVATYDRELEGIRAEAAARVDAARRTVDAERQALLGEVNARIAAKRAEADAANAAARASVRGEVASAVAQVAARAAELATGRAPEAATVQSAVTAAMESAGSR